MSHDQCLIAGQAWFYVMFVLFEGYMRGNNWADVSLYEQAYEEHVD